MYYYLRLLRKKQRNDVSIFFPHPSQANPSGLEKRLKWISQGSNSKICHHLEHRKTGRIYIYIYNIYDSMYVYGIIIYLYIYTYIYITYHILCIQISKIRFEKWYAHQRWTHSQPAKVHKRWRDRRKERGMSNRFYNFSKWPSCTSQLVSVPWRIYWYTVNI